MIRRHPESTRPATLFPYTTLCRSRQFEPPLDPRQLGIFIVAHRHSPCLTTTMASAGGVGGKERTGRPADGDAPHPKGRSEAKDRQRRLRRAAAGLEDRDRPPRWPRPTNQRQRSEEHTSELQSLMPI